MEGSKACRSSLVLVADGASCVEIATRQSLPYRPPLHRPTGWAPAPKQYNPQHARYHSISWRAVRQFVLIRDRYLCQLRLPGCTVKANTVDHIVEAEKGGSDEPRNLR